MQIIPLGVPPSMEPPISLTQRSVGPSVHRSSDFNHASIMKELVSQVRESHRKWQRKWRLPCVPTANMLEQKKNVSSFLRAVLTTTSYQHTETLELSLGIKVGGPLTNLWRWTHQKLHSHIADDHWLSHEIWPRTKSLATTWLTIFIPMPHPCCFISFHQRTTCSSSFFIWQSPCFIMFDHFIPFFPMCFKGFPSFPMFVPCSSLLFPCSAMFSYDVFPCFPMFFLCFPMFHAENPWWNLPPDARMRLGHARSDGADARVGHQLHRDLGLRTHLRVQGALTTSMRTLVYKPMCILYKWYTHICIYIYTYKWIALYIYE